MVAPIVIFFSWKAKCENQGNNISDSNLIQVSEKINIFALKENSIRKTPPAKAESFLMRLFNLDQPEKVVFIRNC